MQNTIAYLLKFVLPNLSSELIKSAKDFHLLEPTLYFRFKV